MATWFSASAVVPSLQDEWGISSGQATWLTAAVQLGFVAGALTSATLNLPDRIPAYRLVAGSAVAAAAFTTAVAAFADGLGVAVPLRFATGFALAGVYPPGLKLMASWFHRGRGLALGALIGALALGSALPHLISVADLPWRGVLLAAAGSAVAAAVVAGLAVRLGPYAAPAPPFQPKYAITLFRERGPRLANLGYFGHMWELYAMWTWLPAYLVASYAERPGPVPVGAVSFAVIGVAGAAGCLIAGWLGDRAGRAKLAALAMITSATCCLLAAVVFGGPPVAVYAVLAVWGASVIADSGLFSTCVSQVVDQRYVGTALTTQTAIGFLLTVVTIQLTPLLADAVSWPVAVAALGLGPAAGSIAMLRLHRLLAPSTPAAEPR